MRIGFIGQGYVGKNYADDFEARGFEIVRYSLEEPYRANKDTVGACDIVFIAVPTPTTPNGFDGHIVDDALSLVHPGNTVVIKSTVLPGMTKDLQKKHSDIIVLFSPEFLREATAAEDAAHPYSNIIGMSEDDEAHRRAAEALRSVLPKAPSEVICSSTEAEFVKYFQNAIGYIDIVAFNIFYDLAQKYGASWEPILTAFKADPNIASRFANPIHKSGRGAGGHCLIKDFAALKNVYQSALPDNERALAVLDAIERTNIALLTESGKDSELVKGVYGDIVKPQKRG